MAEIIKMPKLSDTMTEGVVAKWHKKVGDKVEDGDLLADIETDKATMEYESFQEGYLLYQGVKEGDAGKVDSVLAIVGKKDEDYQGLLDENGSEENDEDGAEEIKSSETGETESGKKEESEIDVSGIDANIIKMPKLSDTMTDGTVAKWHKKKGDQVESGEILAEIETDKATMEFESFEDGTLLYIGVEEGDSAPVDDILAIVGSKDADIDKLIKAFKQKGSHQASDKPETKEEKPAAKVESEKSSSESDKQEKAMVSSDSTDRIKISPLARKLAKEQNIDIRNIKGSGDNGRIVKKDIENYQPSASMGVGVEMEAGKESFEDKPVSQMRGVIARRLGESKFTAPHFYLTIDLDMENAINSRKAINELSEVKVSFNDFVLKAAAMALKKHPQVNSSWQGDTIRTNKHIHIGVAVAVDEGLLVPVVRFADTKQLSQIGTEVKDYAERARNKKLQPKDWEGSTFSISNLGMFGIEEFTAIINPPNACILAIGAIRDEAVVKNGQVVPGKRMKVTLSCDHRVVDGATGSEFLQTFRQMIENPVSMLA